MEIDILKEWGNGGGSSYPVSEWFESSLLPKYLIFGQNKVKIMKSPSTGMCNKCGPSLRKKLGL